LKREEREFADKIEDVEDPIIAVRSNACDFAATTPACDKLSISDLAPREYLQETILGGRNVRPVRAASLTIRRRRRGDAFNPVPLYPATTAPVSFVAFIFPSIKSADADIAETRAYVSPRTSISVSRCPCLAISTRDVRTPVARNILDEIEEEEEEEDDDDKDDDNEEEEEEEVDVEVAIKFETDVEEDISPFTSVLESVGPATRALQAARVSIDHSR